ncbi:Hsp20/alpha crystallin family protein [Methylobacter luteus]|uniref:Hsp20/alpha crystallin family protein n=1 Tax=Methylobacter luteus TaxID=415 RepID=UPI0009DBB437|nr:Hsp20/alpha crystallin family protein [Methylobacter luteus]
MNSSKPSTEKSTGEVNVQKNTGGSDTQQGTQQQGQQGMQRSSGRGLMSFDELDNLFDDFLSRKWPRLFDWNFPMGQERGLGLGMARGFPKVDIVDRDNEIEVQAELPGIKKEDLDVSINNQIMTIRASTKEEKTQEGRYLRREISRGEYQRTLSLPDNVDTENVKASFSDGILRITLPKTAQSQRKSIEIQ